MNKVLKNSWALFLGMGSIMMAYGFQGSLLGVRAVQEEFSLTATGFMMSGYFVGYFIGAATIPNIISRVGHIRVFAAFASLASLVILVHSILINPFIWFLLRVLTGISMVCIYTVAESWLNDRSSNKNRGSVLSIYNSFNVCYVRSYTICFSNYSAKIYSSCRSKLIFFIGNYNWSNLGLVNN